jgi:hypothetical protein
MRNLFILLCAALGFAFTSCKRLDGETVVEGQLIDRDTGQAVKSKGKIAVFAASSGYRFLFEKETDTNGKFAFRFEAEDDCILRGFTDQGYSTTWSDGVELKEGHNNKNLKVKMRAPAWVKFKLINQPPLDTVPVIYIQGFNSDQYGNFSAAIYKLSQDTSFTKEISANETRTITWYFSRNVGMERYEKDLIFPPLDTVEVVIPF